MFSAERVDQWHRAIKRETIMIRKCQKRGSIASYHHQVWGQSMGVPRATGPKLIVFIC